MPPDAELLTLTDRGLYCPAGGFHVDPWRPVERAVLTHGHADHARPGSRHHLAAERGLGVLRRRIGSDADITPLAYGQTLRHGDALVSLHPAGHLLGSAQIRIEHAGRVAVVAGDYKRHPDPTCATFEPVRCDHFVTESTFALPIYRWPDPSNEAKRLNDWWRANRERGETSVVYVYALGKAQRVLAALDPNIGPILCHGAVEGMNEAYREAGVALPATKHASVEAAKRHKGSAIVIAPPSCNGSTWVRKFKPFRSALVSGWMTTRGRRRFRAVDTGFVLSDHADWPGLLDTIDATGAERVWAAHGYTDALARYLRETRSLDAHALPAHRPAFDDDEAA